VVRVWRPLSGGCGFRSDIVSSIQTLKGAFFFFITLKPRVEWYTSL